MFSAKRHVQIDNEGWAEFEADAQLFVVVTFPDRTRWACNFYTLTCIQTIRQDHLSSMDRSYWWASNPLIIVDTINRKHIEEVIDESIANKTFEWLFEYFGPVEEHRLDEYPKDFFEEHSKIEPSYIVRHASTLSQMLEQAGDELKEQVKQLLFGEPVESLNRIEFFTILRGKNIEFGELKNGAAYLKEQWESSFANGLSEEEKKQIYLNQFLWHVFSYEKISCLSSILAAEAFDNENKQQCYIFYQHSKHALLVEDAAELEAADFDNEDDIYVVDRDFKWTYVKTHELQCGPYFKRIS